MTSWGALLDEGSKSMEVAIWQLLFPAGFMVVTLFCFNFLGDGLRDALDPKDRDTQGPVRRQGAIRPVQGTHRVHHGQAPITTAR